MKNSNIVLKGREYYGGTVAPPDSFEDESRFGNDGVHSGVTWVQLSSGLWVRSFDGVNDYVDCGANVMQGYKSLTLLAWIWRSSADAGEHYICNRWGGDIYWTLNGNALSGYLSIGGANVGPCNSVATFSDSKWHLAAFRWDGAHLQMFVDGVANGAEVDAAGVIGAPVSNFIIGTNSAKNNFWLDAKLGSFRMFNCALSAGEIQSHYDSTKGWYL